MMMRAWARIVFGRRAVMAGKVCACGLWVIWTGSGWNRLLCGTLGGGRDVGGGVARKCEARKAATRDRPRNSRQEGGQQAAARGAQGSWRGREVDAMPEGWRRRTEGSGGWRPVHKGAGEERCVREDAGCSRRGGGLTGRRGGREVGRGWCGRTAAARKSEVCKDPVVRCQDLPLRASRVCSVGPGRGLVMETVMARMRCRAPWHVDALRIGSACVKLAADVRRCVCVMGGIPAPAVELEE